MYARNTNVRRHPVGASRVCRLTLVPGGAVRAGAALSHTRVLRAVIAPEAGLLGRGLEVCGQGYAPLVETGCGPRRRQ